MERVHVEIPSKLVPFFFGGGGMLHDKLTLRGAGTFVVYLMHSENKHVTSLEPRYGLHC